MKTELDKVRTRLENCKRPLFFFFFDPDGLASFLVLYKLIREGKGMALKGAALDERFAERVNEYIPDLVIILDKAKVEDSFFESVKAPCVWIDHHDVQEAPREVLYSNPRKEGKNLSTSYLAYQITGEDAWIAAVGVVSDWQLPEKNLWKRLEEEYPGYLPVNIKDAGTALYTTKIGELARVFSFNLKGRMSDVLTSMKILSRIKNPDELLKREHSQARLVMKKYDQRLKEYKEILNQVTVDEKDPVILFTYDNGNSFTTDLANELLYKHPAKIIIIARETAGSYKCSLRAAQFRLDELLEEVLEEVKGSGGGHEHACGAVIPSEEFERFVEIMREKAATGQTRAK